MGGCDGEDGGGRTFPILYITTPDQPPHGGVTGMKATSGYVYEKVFTVEA